MSLEWPDYTPIDMVQLLSQIIVKVTLQEMLIIDEHKEKSMAWVNDVSSSVKNEHKSDVITVKEQGNKK